MGEAAKSFSPTAPARPLPRRVGRRVLLKLAARGGMGEVYLAATTGIEGAERPCIVKTVRRDYIHDASFLARFLDEARVQAQLQHPGVAQVLEAATDDDGEPYTVVEYVEGRSLGELRQRALQAGVRVSWADAAAVAVEIAQALAHVHERSRPDGSPLGIVHRDLSPQNVMIGHAGEIKLIDFGTARGHNRRCHTVAGVVFAKPGYVAPEVARQQVGDGRIDLYALGVILWELCAGRRFLSVDPQRHLDDVAAGRVIVPPISEGCGAPPELDTVIARLTRNDPDERYPRASLAVPDLAALLASAPSAGTEAGARGVRARTASLMRRLWPHEPGRMRAEFARLLHEAGDLLVDEGRAFDASSKVGLRQAATDGASAAPAAGRSKPDGASAAPAAGRSKPDGASAAPAAGRSKPDDPSRLAGTPYRVLRVIGEGASGTVWEAEHVELGRRLAIKVLSAEHASSSDSIDRFRREARALAGLSHPNLVEILDFGTAADGRVFLAMELCLGETLGAKLRGGPLAWTEAAQIGIQACDALATAHSAGIVHRDIKPQNLMLTRGGTVKLLDFGVAVAHAEAAGPPVRAAGPRERALWGFTIFGTPEYMAPEQVAGGAIDPRADVYSLGCVFYEMLTGAPPFEGSAVVVMGKHVRETARSPRSPAARGLRDPRAPARGAIPGAVEAIVMRAMAKDPGERFPSASAMGAALEQALAAPERRRIHERRVAHMVAWALLAMGILACLSVLFFTWSPDSGSRLRPAASPPGRVDKQSTISPIGARVSTPPASSAR
jgi:eukaryotic-like serine/threonine-protein kinase